MEWKGSPFESRDFGDRFVASSVQSSRQEKKDRRGRRECLQC